MEMHDTTIYNISARPARVKVLLRTYRGNPTRRGMGLDQHSHPAYVEAEAALGSAFPFGGYQDDSLLLAVQTISCLAGVALPRGQVEDDGLLVCRVLSGVDRDPRIKY
jgi:hypothetical protein